MTAFRLQLLSWGVAFRRLARKAALRDRLVVANFESGYLPSEAFVRLRHTLYVEYNSLRGNNTGRAELSSSPDWSPPFSVVTVISRSLNRTAAHHNRLTPNASNCCSFETRRSFSSKAWATRIRSKGSRWTPGSVPATCAWYRLMGKSVNP